MQYDQNLYKKRKLLGGGEAMGNEGDIRDRRKTSHEKAEADAASCCHISRRPGLPNLQVKFRHFRRNITSPT